jgi:two-component system, OmpR family, KDP operon response regulator KdpE
VSSRGPVSSGPSRPELTRPVRVLVVEDQAELQRALRINLRARQYEVLAARTGREALALAASQPPDAVILDLGLPDIDGTEVIVELRRWYRAPIIVLSGRTSPGDKIGALDVGADDYVTKPFAMAELLARLRAALRRDESELAHDQPRQVVIGHWRVDLTAHQVTRVTPEATEAAGALADADGLAEAGLAGDGLAGAGLAGDGLAGAGLAGAGGGPVQTLRLTPTEWRILELLLQRPGQLVGSAQILTGVWGPGFQQRTNYLRFHMARLRRKLEDNPARPRHLLTEPGMGYRYQPLARLARSRERRGCLSGKSMPGGGKCVCGDAFSSARHRFSVLIRFGLSL